jgi:hypothetical protein
MRKRMNDMMMQFHMEMQKFWPSLLFVFSVKLILFAYLAYNFNVYWDSGRITNYIFIKAGDSIGYYLPAESFASGKGYHSVCRMPGLLPIYSLARLFLSVGATKVMIVILQFICGVISVRALALVAGKVFNAKVYTLTLVIYTVSTFVSVWDNYGLSDSFSVSFMIFSTYFLFRFGETKNFRYAFLSGVFFTWCFFFRPVSLGIIPLFYIYIFISSGKFKAFFVFVKNVTVFTIPVVIFLGWWMYHNYKMTHRIIVLQDTMENCYSGAYPLHYQKLRDLSTSWGGDYQKNSVGGEMNWFLDPSIDYKKVNPFGKRIFTKDYNIDSLIKLREAYHLSRSVGLSDSARNYFIDYVSARSDFYKISYMREHYLSYLILNRLRICLKFCFPLRLDDLPLPKLSEMSFFQKVFKGFYLILFHFISLLGLFSGVVILFERNLNKMLFYCFPLMFLLILGGYFGFIEMRYFAPIYPFFVVFACYIINKLYQKSKFSKNV